MKHGIVLFILLVACISTSDRIPTAAAPARQIALIVDGKEMPSSPPPMLQEGRVYIPVTAARRIGLGVQMQGPRRASLTWWPTGDSRTVITAGTNKAWFASNVQVVPFTYSGTPYIYRGMLMIPARLLVREGLDEIKVEWDPEAMAVRIRRRQDFVRVRLRMDEELVKAQPNRYSHIWLGDYVPAI